FGVDGGQRLGQTGREAQVLAQRETRACARSDALAQLAECLGLGRSAEHCEPLALFLEEVKHWQDSRMADLGFGPSGATERFKLESRRIRERRVRRPPLVTKQNGVAKGRMRRGVVVIHRPRGLSQPLDAIGANDSGKLPIQKLRHPRLPEVIICKLHRLRIGTLDGQNPPRSWHGRCARWPAWLILSPG